MVTRSSLSCPGTAQGPSLCHLQARPTGVLQLLDHKTSSGHETQTYVTMDTAPLPVAPDPGSRGNGTARRLRPLRTQDEDGVEGGGQGKTPGK